MTTEELDELERKAKAATPGPWEFVTEGQSTVWAGNGDIPVADIPNKHILNYGAENGPHIAKCDPQTILRLIAAARENAALRYAMTPAQFAERMRACEGGDEEMQHMEADKLMVELLLQLGYVEGVEVFEKMDKWYA